MNFFYIIPDGLKISGLLTWGLNLRSITQNCKLLFLNQDSPLPKSFKPENDFRRIETQASHNVKIVTDELENFVKLKVENNSNIKIKTDKTNLNIL